MSETNKNRRLVVIMLAIAVLMFGFGYALVPLYDVFCDVTGINGKTSNEVFAGDIGAIDKKAMSPRFLS